MIFVSRKRHLEISRRAIFSPPGAVPNWWQLWACGIRAVFDKWSWKAIAVWCGGGVGPSIPWLPVEGGLDFRHAASHLIHLWPPCRWRGRATRRHFSQLLTAAGDYVRPRHPELRSLLVGMFEQDPLLRVCKGASLYHYDTNLFLVYWDERSVRSERFTSQDLYLELGCL